MIYFIQQDHDGPIKIGYTADNVEGRLRALQTGNGSKLYLLGTVDGTKRTEMDLHRRFARLRIQGEWFKASTELLGFIEDRTGSQIPLIGMPKQNPRESKWARAWRHGLLLGVWWTALYIWHIHLQIAYPYVSVYTYILLGFFGMYACLVVIAMLNAWQRR